MPKNNMVRAQVGATIDMNAKPSVSVTRTDLHTIAQYMFALMLRNVTSDGYVLDDPNGLASKPGCVIAAPSYPRHTPGVDQDYVFNWVRDAAITAIEIAAAKVPTGSLGGVQTLIDYVNFALLCQGSAKPTLGHACFTVDGQPRPWTEQSDGPALQTLGILAAWTQLDELTKATARKVIGANLDYLLVEYQNPTTNLWEEHQGLSFFARSVQLRCFREIADNALGIEVPTGVADAIAWLTDALTKHWNGSYYLTMLAPPSPGDPRISAIPDSIGYDPNIDIVCASIYGAVPVTDTKLLATAALLRSQWADPDSQSFYAINRQDQMRAIGPLLGRYPGDLYDGDMQAPRRGGHPWALCTCNFAELYYHLANAIQTREHIPFDEFSMGFFAQLGITKNTTPAEAVSALRNAADQMLYAVIFHSDHLELSEQYDGTSGFEKSVTNLTWSYAAFLSAVRARN